jgi:serine protease
MLLNAAPRLFAARDSAANPPKLRTHRVPSTAVSFLIKPQFRHLLCCALLGAMGSALASEAATDRIIVKWRNADVRTEIDSARVRGLATRVGKRLAAGRMVGGGMSVVQLEQALPAADVGALLSALRADPDVEFAEPDRRMKIQAVTPNDPLFSGQWYLQSDQPAAIRANGAWEVTRGGSSPAVASVVVAVLDTGVRLDHPDLQGKLLQGYDFVSGTASSNFAVANDGNGWDTDPTDPGDFISASDLSSTVFKNNKCGGGVNQDQPTPSTWHGTRVSGMLAANTDNAVGIAGAGFNIRVLPVRVLGKCGGFESDVIAGMYWAAGLVIPPPLLQQTDLPNNATPAQVINMSLGADGACGAGYATAVRDITAHGVLVVASAGNEGQAVGTPASCAGALAVAGVRHIGTKVGYSNLGPEVGIAAPAGNCVNVGPNEPCLFSLDTITNDGGTAPGANAYTNRFSTATFGTSFASPLAAATAGLMKAVHPALTPAMLISRIRSSARAFPTSSDSTPQPPSCQLPTIAALQAAECICTTAVCGAGLLNAEGAVNTALRPAVFAEFNGVLAAGRSVSLDGSRTSVAQGRSIASFAWTVVSTSNGATVPSVANSNLAIANVTLPTQGTVVFRLTVTDNVGASDFAELTATVAGVAGTGGSTSPPPATSSGGGGTMQFWLLLLGATLLASQYVKRCSSRR